MTYGSYWIYEGELAKGPIDSLHFYWMFPVFTTVFFIIVSFWVWIPWRTHLPLVFNRSTQKISFWYENELWQGDWKKAEAHTMTVGSVGYGVGVTNEPLLSLNVIRDVGDYPKDKRNLYLKIYGTKHNREFSAHKPLSVQAQQIWEYIRLYMNEGIEAVPPPIHNKVIWEYQKFSDIFPENWKGLKEFYTNKNYISGVLFAFPFFWISLFIDSIYFYLNRWLPRKAIPPELQATIDARGTTHDK